VVEENGLDVVHLAMLTTGPSGFVHQYFSFTLVVGHRRGPVELIGGLGVATEPCR
jgi:hypothetical protein